MIAPEDITIGAHIVILQQIHEYPSFLWCGESTLFKPEQPVRITMLPCEPEPLRVRAICLPYVLVKSPRGERRMIDVREVSVGVIPEPVGRVMYSSLKPRDKRTKSK